MFKGPNTDCFESILLIHLIELCHKYKNKINVFDSLVNLNYNLFKSMFSHYSYSETSASRRRFCDILFSKTQIQTIMQEIDGHCKKLLVHVQHFHRQKIRGKKKEKAITFRTFHQTSIQYYKIFS